MPTDVLEDFLDLEPFAAQIKRHPRTVRRWMDKPNGLPSTKVGSRLLIHVPTARAWMLSRMRNVDRSRKLGARQKRTHNSKQQT
jgi:hypothetical protein